MCEAPTKLAPYPITSKVTGWLNGSFEALLKVLPEMNPSTSDQVVLRQLYHAEDWSASSPVRRCFSCGQCVKPGYTVMHDCQHNRHIERPPQITSIK
ncbi:hypothetical protein T265_03690 [Opisthorchis viverrini]|uniref:Uncharacterized protein n=1 Tax=Opisthorchis viverrini TaxID=6198 RepID=A0A074ZRR2_OPIVI|nr:hypothetical protein T265_03690 [Opisthorchis viverrini]KER29781.1 hypothetical protein T265_03690 [Opisthorchis viverrini]